MNIQEMPSLKKMILLIGFKIDDKVIVQIRKKD